MNNISLRDYFDMRIRNVEDKLEAQAQFMAQHFQLNEMAIKKAEDSMTLRLVGLNEWREQNKDEREVLATKEALVSIAEALDKRLLILEKGSAFSAGKLWMVMAGFVAIPIIISIIALIWK